MAGAWFCVAWAAAAGPGGRELGDVLRELEAAGLDIVYSSDLVRPGMRVETVPRSQDPRSMLHEIVAPFGLTVARGPGGSLLLVRRQRGETDAGVAAPAAGGAIVELEEVVVSASHYRLAMQASPPRIRLSAGGIESLPELADDPIRAVTRLPGTARQDFASKPNIRGGLGDETLVRFDGLRLYNPYHLKDFQSLVSTIDPGVIEDLSVYTGGFPVNYGDRMSGVIDIRSVQPTEPFEGRVSASLFNAGGRIGGRFAGCGDWLVSARRGTLDLVLEVANPDLGRPVYADLYGRVERCVGDALRVSANALVFDDDLVVNDVDQEERARAGYRDQYYWLRFDYGAGGDGGGRLLASRTRLASTRMGEADLPGIGRGALRDRRDFTIDSIVAEGWWPFAGGSVVEAGAEWRHMRGSYRYRDSADFDLLFDLPGAPDAPARSRDIALRPRGDHVGAYLTLGTGRGGPFAADLGLRWDQHSLAGLDQDVLSPRAMILWSPAAGTRLRLGWGRFFQTQSVDELQVSDGDATVHRAQRADQLVASIERTLGRGFELRLEGYRKAYRHLRPRYENLLESLFVLPELKPDRIRIDPSSATAKGLELSLGYDAGESLTGWASYSWSSVDDRISPSLTRRAWDHAHSVGAGIARRGPRWEFTLAALWHSGWPSTEVELAATDPVPLVSVGQVNGSTLRDYARLDARVARRFTFDGGSELTVFLEVSNLTDRRNDCCSEYEIEIDDGAAELDVVPRESLPLLPSLGFVWEF